MRGWSTRLNSRLGGGAALVRLGSTPEWPPTWADRLSLLRDKKNILSISYFYQYYKFLTYNNFLPGRIQIKIGL